jgi:hypothetical protein
MPSKRFAVPHLQRLAGACVVAALVVGLQTPAAAQGIVEDPDWKELEVPPPPSFDKDNLVKLDMPPYVTLKFGIDPATLAITSDGVVRYVVVTTNSTGSVGAMYEGIRCASGEFKTYARFSSAGQWSALKDPKWRPLNDNNTSRHALALARNGACDSRAVTASSVAAIVAGLKSKRHQLPSSDPRI